VLLDAGARRALLDEFERIDAQLSGAEELTAPADDLIQRRVELLLAYQDGFPLRPVSRCPFTGEVLALPIDTFDLDGLWWSWAAPVRGAAEEPSTLLAMTGAVAVKARVPSTSRRCRPGPAVPYVLPRLLAHGGVRAVVSAVPVDGHDAVLVAYYGRVGLDEVGGPVNDWGSSYTMRIVDGDVEVLHGDERAEAAEERDGDLERWIASGKLGWIAPDDDGLAVRGSLEGCPFLGRSGSLALQEIVGGVVVPDPDWSGEYR
jgi:hypothetical protein